MKYKEQGSIRMRARRSDFTGRKKAEGDNIREEMWRWQEEEESIYVQKWIRGQLLYTWPGPGDASQ